MLNINDKNIVERVKNVRKQYNLTQDTFAKELGVGRAYIGQFETYSIAPSIDLIVKVSTIFRVDLRWLLLGIGEMKMYEKDTSKDAPLNAPLNAPLKSKKELQVVATIEDRGAYKPAQKARVVNEPVAGLNTAQLAHNKVLNDILTVLTGLQAEVINLKEEVSRLSQAKDTTKLQ